MEDLQFRICVLILIPFLLQGCAKPKTYNPLPEKLESHAQVPGFHNCRAWGDEQSSVLVNSIRESIEQEKMANGKLKPNSSALILSGGGQEGAFGAGLLCGWSKLGTRPNFKLITGISVGALIAPFAFLGSEYDDLLKEAFTTTSESDVYKKYSIFSIILSTLNIHTLTSAADNKPLARTIERFADDKMLNKIADEHLKGRRLLIGTGQMNAERLVIWDMGAIALHRTPEAFALFRKILLASVSIPDFFSPTEFEVEACGEIFTEMHVDGGNENQLFLLGKTEVPEKFITNLYIIRNSKVSAEWKNVELKLTDIAAQSIGSLTKAQGIGDLFRIYTYSLHDDIGYNLVYIPSMFKQEPSAPIESTYMKKLFTLGYNMGRVNEKWRQYPPLYTPTQKAPGLSENQNKNKNLAINKKIVKKKKPGRRREVNVK